jgi:antitoxin component YwqK of YwqJK toxin-antitoxin module
MRKIGAYDIHGFGTIYFVLSNKKINDVFNDLTKKDKNIIEIHYFDGMKEGMLQKKYVNEQLEVQNNYINCKREGICRMWYENGQIKRECNFTNNKMNGISSVWNDQGYLIHKRREPDGYANDEMRMYQYWPY